jgi:hypothetical protein
LDVVNDTEWVISLGDAFARQYDLYAISDGHAALLHRCLGMLLQKVDDRVYVSEKIDWMCRHSSMSVPINRLGLAQGIGLVAASHLDTVLEKLKNILDNAGLSALQRSCIQLVQFISEFMTSNSAGSSHFSHLVQKWKMWMTHTQHWL